MTTQKYILLAEDDPEDRELFIEAISIVDPKVVVGTVENGERLMTYLKETQSPPDCIFLDLNMPRKSGKECLREIRQEQKMSSIPVVIYTTSINRRDVDEAYDYGAFCFIRKPSTFKELTDLFKKNLAALLAPAERVRMKSAFVVNPGKSYGA